MKPLSVRLMLIAFSAITISLFVWGAASATIHTVQVGSFFFSPTKTHIEHGDTVRWVWASGFHTTTSDGSSPKAWSHNLNGSGQFFDVQFTLADGNGPFPYHCENHPSSMKDTIFVTSSTVEVIPGPGLPEDYSLDQNYPNPFNPSTTIKFTLSHSSNVEFSVFNIAGEAVEHEGLGMLRAGNYSVTWNSKSSLGASLPSGVYFYQIRAGEFAETKKMLLLK